MAKPGAEQRQAGPKGWRMTRRPFSSRFHLQGKQMTGRTSIVLIGLAVLALYWGFAAVMRSMGSDMPYPTDFLPSSWQLKL